MVHAVIAGGAGATLSLEQVLNVVAGGEVVLDSAASHRLKKESPAPKSFQAEQPPAAPSACGGSSLGRAQARAALFYKLLALINGRSGVRLSVAEALATLLNAGVAPSLPAADANKPALAALADLLQGVGSATAADGTQLDAAAALAAAGVEVPGLSAAERAVLQDGQAAAAGTAAICIQAGKTLLASANAVAALSAEALQADVGAGQGRGRAAQQLGGWATADGGDGGCQRSGHRSFTRPPPLLPHLPAGQGSGCRGGGGAAAQGRGAGGRGDARPARRLAPSQCKEGRRGRPAGRHQRSAGAAGQACS